ncbi:MAG: hypothetical protein JSW73_02920 [Candidatus Woesearchaeota archaeon]|nr:MAG: hypothetical protein JSW73_02920 [Candidatus Woesearchaeota archaeon]
MVKIAKADQPFIQFGLDILQDLESCAQSPELVVVGRINNKPDLIFAGRIWDAIYDISEYIMEAKDNKKALKYYIISNTTPVGVRIFEPIGYKKRRGS